MIPFLPWRPDIAAVNGQGVSHIEGIMPAGGGIWRPVPAFSAVTAAASGQVFGSASIVQPDGTLSTFVGTAGTLELLDNSASTFSDVSQAATTYAATADAPWAFERFGEHVIAVNVNDAPQKYQIGTSTEFADLGGTPPQAHLVSVWKDQLVLGGLLDDLEAVIWSEINDIDDWTGGNSDTQSFPGFGRVMGLSRGNVPMIVFEHGVQRGIFTGDVDVFNFDILVENLGCALPGACCFDVDTAFFWSDEGFIMVGRDGAVARIGANKVDRWFKDRVDRTVGVRAFADPAAPRIYWFFRESTFGAQGGGFDSLLIYDRPTNEWGLARCDLEWPLAFQPTGETLETLDDFGTMETLPFSLDSPTWQGGAPVIGGVDHDHKAGSFSGFNQAAHLETGEFGEEGRRSYIRRARPLIDVFYSPLISPPMTVIHRGRENRGEFFANGPAEPVFGGDQSAVVDRSARWHKLDVHIEAGRPWTAATGVEVESEPAGRW